MIICRKWLRNCAKGAQTGRFRHFQKAYGGNEHRIWGVWMGAKMKIDVIIPVYKPDKRLIHLIECLERQTMPFQNIILMNTEEKYLEQLLYGTHFYEKHRRIKVYNLSKREFNHGKTRHIGVTKSDAEVFLMMTQDAVPADDQLLEDLVSQLHGNVAVAYARQIPEEGCGEGEKFMRQFNYPAESRIKTQADQEELGVKTFFCSNVCAAYRRDIYDELGGFPRHTIFNEDMIYAAVVIKAGFWVAYDARVCVIHSHDYTTKQQFRRNFDLGVSQADFPEIFSGVPSVGEGKKMVRETAAYLKSKKLYADTVKLYLQSAARYAGYLFGKHYSKLPRNVVLTMTMNKEYWYQTDRRRDLSKIDPTKGYGRSESETFVSRDKNAVKP
jgi:rhamnosyltransferase